MTRVFESPVTSVSSTSGTIDSITLINCLIHIDTHDYLSSEGTDYKIRMRFDELWKFAKICKTIGITLR